MPNDKAHEVFEDIKKYKSLFNYSYIQMGELLLRVQREKLYKDLGHSSYGSFLSDPDVAIPRGTAYLYTSIYKFYIEFLALDPEIIMDVEVSRLREIIPLIRAGGNAEEWLSKARSLGRKDYINEVREAKGLPELDGSSASGPGPDEPKPATYLEIVKASPCLICGTTPVDPHHFPQTSVRTDDDNKVIPLCRKHHDEAGRTGVETFIDENGKAVFDWFYGVIDLALAKK